MRRSHDAVILPKPCPVCGVEIPRNRPGCQEHKAAIVRERKRLGSAGANQRAKLAWLEDYQARRAQG